ncbi:MAG: phosphate starvation-inducible protein PhoH [Planctomycetes bacterium]|nr:phosphate starvation-inducible protein PhoH [Planctomycetota bacterium]
METRLPLLSLDEEKLILGPYDRHVKQVSRRLGVRLSSRGGELRFQGPDDAVQALVPRVEDLLTRMRRGDKLGPLEVETALLGSMDPSAERARSVFGEALPDETQPRRMPTARTEAQRVYLEALQRDDLILATGPAGTGKTYLAVAAALQALRRGEVKRLVLTRPVVEAGERLGFLPGDLEDKIDPYLRPLFDAMSDLLGPAQARRMRELDIVEIAPLAFMRGRTLARSYVILDEAQNATTGQLKMFLTRLGEGTRAVVTGDRTQSDLPQEQKGGLADAIDRLQGTPGVSWIEFSKADVQRSALVQRIVEAYGDDE